MNFHKANELWVNTAVISSSFPLRRECWVSQGQKGTNCLTVKESHRKTLLFFCFLKGPLWREEQAVAVRFTTCRDAECRRISAWLSWAGQDIGDWVLTYPQVKMMVGASFGETNGSGPPADLRPQAKVCLKVPLCTRGADLLHWSLQGETHSVD